MNVLKFPTKDRSYDEKIEACLASLDPPLQERAKTYGVDVLLIALTEVLGQAVEAIDRRTGQLLVGRIQRRVKR